MALFVEVFRMLWHSGEEVAHRAGAWARESFYSISFVLTRALVYSALLVLTAVTLSVLTGWWGPLVIASVLLLPFLAFVLTGYRTLNAAAVTLLADLAMAKLAGKIKFHTPWHNHGAVEYTGTNIGEELHILAFFAKTIVWAVVMEYMIILFCMAIPVGYVPYLPFILFTGLMTWVLVSTVWGQQTRIPAALVVALTIIASLGYTIPMLNNIGSVRRMTNATRNWDSTQQQRANAAEVRGMEAESVLADLNTRITTLQSKMMRNTITDGEKEELNQLIQRRNTVESLATGTYDGRTNLEEKDESSKGSSILPDWQFPAVFGGFDLNPQDAPRLIVLALALIMIAFGLLGVITSFIPVRKHDGEDDKDFKTRKDERRANRKTNIAAVAFGIALLFFGTMFVNWAISRIPEQRSIHEINREALERSRTAVPPTPPPVVTRDVAYSTPRQYNCVDAQFLTLDQPWHHTGFELKPGGSLRVTITSHEVRTAGGPSCPITGCSPTPQHLEGLRTTQHPHMALLGKVGENQIFAVLEPSFIIPAEVVGTGQLKLSHNLRTVLPNGARATHDWANLEGQVCFQVEVL